MRVAQQSQPRGLGHQPHDLGGGGVGAAIIDIEDLIGAPPVEGGADLGDQRRDVLGLVAYGDDDGQVHEVDSGERGPTGWAQTPTGCCHNGRRV